MEPSALPLHPRAVRGRRGPKEPVDPRRPLGVFRETERRLDGSTADVLTVLIAGAECPFTCVFCDLWRFTLDGPTPEGAIPTQLDAAFAAHDDLPRDAWIKLYNASNWFDERAVPSADDERLLATLEPRVERVIVENHPRLGGDRVRAWSDRLGPGRLQVALGLETVDPRVFPRLGKGATLDEISRALDRSHAIGASTRVFVLLGLPWLSLEEALEAAVRSTDWALDRGVEHVALVPLRLGNGSLDRLADRGELEIPDLAQVENAVERCLAIARGRGVVTVDAWDLGDRAACNVCGPRRRARLEAANLSGRLDAPIACGVCG